MQPVHTLHFLLIFGACRRKEIFPGVFNLVEAVSLLVDRRIGCEGEGEASDSILASSVRSAGVIDWSGSCSNSPVSVRLGCACWLWLSVAFTLIGEQSGEDGR